MRLNVSFLSTWAQPRPSLLLEWVEKQLHFLRKEWQLTYSSPILTSMVETAIKSSSYFIFFERSLFSSQAYNFMMRHAFYVAGKFSVDLQWSMFHSLALSTEQTRYFLYGTVSTGTLYFFFLIQKYFKDWWYSARIKTKWQKCADLFYCKATFPLKIKSQIIIWITERKN